MSLRTGWPETALPNHHPPLCLPCLCPCPLTRLQLVTPIFAFLSVEVDKKGTDKVEVAARVTYDDVNESLCMAEVVRKVGWLSRGDHRAECC